MTPETKRIVLCALEYYIGDDVFRARAAFKGLSHAEMQMEHGQSGRTRQQILDGYTEHYDAVHKAIQEVKSC